MYTSKELLGYLSGASLRYAVDEHYRINGPLLSELAHSIEFVSIHAQELQEEFNRLWITAYSWSVVRPITIVGTMSAMACEQPIAAGLCAILAGLSTIPEPHLAKSLRVHTADIDLLAQTKTECTPQNTPANPLSNHKPFNTGYNHDIYALRQGTKESL
jgi:hypothetical protein